MERSADELIDLFTELGLVGRRARSRGTSVPLAHRAQQSKDWQAHLEQVSKKIKTVGVDHSTHVHDDFDEVINSVANVRDDWALENLYSVEDWQGLDTLLEGLRECDFASLLHLAIAEFDNIVPVIDAVFIISRVTPQAVLDCDSGLRLHEYSGEEVLLGYLRIASLAEWLRDGEVPDDRYTDAERQLYFSSTKIDERVRDWLFYELWDLDESLRSRHARAEQIAKLMVLHPSKSHVATYLRTVYRTYVEGFVPETVVMCGALLERSTARAYRMLIRDQSVLEEPNLPNQLKILKENRWLSHEQFNDAQNVRIRRNKAVHEDPEIVRDSFSTVEAVLRVVNAIERKCSKYESDTI